MNSIKKQDTKQELNTFTKMSVLMDKCFFSALLFVFLGVIALFTYLYFEAENDAYIQVMSNAKTANITVTTLIRSYFSSLIKIQKDFSKTNLLSGSEKSKSQNGSIELKYLSSILNTKFVRHIFFIDSNGKIRYSIPNTTGKLTYNLQNMPKVASIIKKNKFPAMSHPFTKPFNYTTIALVSQHYNQFFEKNGYICFIIDFEAFGKYLFSSPYINRENERIWVFSTDKKIIINSENDKNLEAPNAINSFLKTSFTSNSNIASYNMQTSAGYKGTVFTSYSKLNITENTKWIICAEAFKNSLIRKNSGFPVFYIKPLVIFCILLLVLMFINRYFIKRYIAVLEYTVDITSHEKEKIETTLSSVLEILPYILFETDKKGRFTFINAPGTNIKGFNPDSMKGKYIFDFAVLAENELKQIFNRILIEKETVKHFRLEMKFTPNSENRYVSLNAAPISDKNGNVYAVRGLFNDVTERVELETHLIQARKQDVMAMIISGIAHDFNNYICSILGYIELINQNGYKHSIIHKVEKTSRKAALLAGQLLAFSREKNSNNPICSNLNETLTGILDILKISLPALIKIYVDIEENLPPVHASAFQIEQIIMNLIINARDAMPKGGKVSISAWATILSKKNAAAIDLDHGDYVILKVADTGHGLDNNMQKKIFEPYFTTKDYGTGIGLASVRILVKNAGGNILVKSKENIGSEFVVYIPVIKIDL